MPIEIHNIKFGFKEWAKKQERAWFKTESGERHIKLTRIYYKEKSQEMNTLEKKIQFGRKISVFISSKCGDEKYDNIRQRLKSLIEKTGFADVYLFENSPASSLSAQKEYIYELDDSDVCIFLIDNADGVPSGVLKEYQRVKVESRPKQFYIFCNENKKEPTHIQEEISKPDGPKYYITQSFDKFVEVGYMSLIYDIRKIYINYCKDRLIDSEFADAAGNIEEIDIVASESLDKQIFKNIDKTKNIISKQIYSRSDKKIENTCEFDEYSYKFLLVLLNAKNIREYNTSLLLHSLEEMQSENLHKVVTERWKAIQSYFMDDIEQAIKYEEHALDLARELLLPNWIIQDILIDLRNLYTFDEQSKNQILINNTAQRELDSEPAVLFYPLLDRYEKSLYEKIIQQTNKSSMRSPYSIVLADNPNKYSDLISNAYIMAVFNGSLTHLLRTMDHIKNVAFHLCQQYSDWEFRVLLIKMSLIKGNKSEIKRITSLFNDVYGKMNGKDAKKIYEFVKGNPIKYQRNIAQLLAFQHLGYFFDDYFYEEVWQEISTIVLHWIDSDDRFLALGDYLFDAIGGNTLRIDNDLIVSILKKVLDNEIKRYYDNALEVLSKLDYREVSAVNSKEVFSTLIELLKDDNLRKTLRNLANALISLRKQIPDFYTDLDTAVTENMPEFFENQYSLETQKRTQAESKAYICKFIDQINDRNQTQGRNGCYSGYMDNPYETIKNIINVDEVELEKEMVYQIIQSNVDTLYAEGQTFDAKANALKLITFLRSVSDDRIYDYESLINQLVTDEERVVTGAESSILLDKTSRTTIYFNFSMMKLVFNKIDVEEILSLLSSYSDLDTFEKLEALKTIILIFENDNLIDDKILLLILQFTLGSTSDPNHDVRYYATKALLLILTSDNKEPIMKNISSLMDYDSAYIKEQIINNSEKLKSIDEGTFDFIKEKALVDNHFYIRKRARDL